MYCRTVGRLVIHPCAPARVACLCKSFETWVPSGGPPPTWTAIKGRTVFPPGRRRRQGRSPTARRSVSWTILSFHVQRPAGGGWWRSGRPRRRAGPSGKSNAAPWPGDVRHKRQSRRDVHDPGAPPFSRGSCPGRDKGTPPNQNRRRRGAPRRCRRAGPSRAIPRGAGVGGGSHDADFFPADQSSCPRRGG